MSPPQYHVHIDCTHGLSAPSLYAACRNLAQEMGRDGATNSTAMAAEDDEFVRILARLGLPRKNHDQQYLTNDEEHWIAILEAEDEIGLPLLVRNTATHALQWMSQRQEAVAVCSHSETTLELAVVGSIWWFHRLGIHSHITCSPLPSSPLMVKMAPDLFKNLPIALEMDEAKRQTSIADDGVVLLKALLTMASSTISIRDAPPPMVLRFVVTGLDCTTLLVGQRIQQTGSIEPAVHGLAARPESAEQSTLWLSDQDLSLLETNVDDTTAENLSFALEILMQHQGVADCWITPIVMKKGRSAHTFHCLCRNEHRNTVLEAMFRHVPTLGVRIQCHQDGLSRAALRRITITVPFRVEDMPDLEPTTAQFVDCKVAYLGSDVVSVKAEFDHCKRIATESEGRLTVSSIREQAAKKAMDQLSREAAS